MREILDSIYFTTPPDSYYKDIRRGELQIEDTLQKTDEISGTIQGGVSQKTDEISGTIQGGVSQKPCPWTDTNRE